MKVKLALALFVCVMLVVSAGCETLRGTKPASDESAALPELGIPLAADFRIADLPLPAGFEMDREHSFVFQNSAMDLGRIQYSGKDKIDAIGQFYLDEMPRYNWTLLNVTEHDTVIMSFDKPTKSCQVVLSPKTRGTLTVGTIIQLIFFPKETP